MVDLGEILKPILALMSQILYWDIYFFGIHTPFWAWLAFFTLAGFIVHLFHGGD